MIELVASVPSARSDALSTDSDDSELEHAIDHDEEVNKNGATPLSPSQVSSTKGNEEIDNADSSTSTPGSRGIETNGLDNSLLVVHPRHSHRGRRSSLDFMPVKQQLGFIEQMALMRIQCCLSLFACRPASEGHQCCC